MPALDINAIKKLLPHRYPMLLVDAVTDYKVGEWIRGAKNVSVNEPYFQGHFPHYPVMPGDTLAMQVDLVRAVRGVGRFRARADVGPHIVCEALLLAAVREMPKGDLD
jgi:3-hydroxymyristoyl/3-hydroxydecanoyl-(acyl carrier protein) dehydratase